MKRILPILSLIIINLSCGLYQNNEEPDIYFQFLDFDILKLGRTFSDMAISDDGKNIFLSDYNNNSILHVDVEKNLILANIVIVGSHPIAIDLNADDSKLAITHEGESVVKVINTEIMSIENSFPVSLMNMNDLIFVNDTTIILSSKTDPSCVTLNINTGEEVTQSVLNGEFAINTSNSTLFVATSSSLKKYNWVNNRFYQDPSISDPYGFVGNINHLIYNNEKDIILTCISDKENIANIQHVYSYNANDMTFAGKYQIKSPGLAVTITPDGERIFAAPKDSDEIGVFIIEFSQNTKLETNYYLSAGNLSKRGICIDPNEKYLYTLVNIPGDDDSFEPYNDFSFDLQRIKIN